MKRKVLAGLLSAAMVATTVFGYSEDQSGRKEI